jgi:hypothetical protein
VAAGTVAVGGGTAAAVGDGVAAGVGDGAAAGVGVEAGVVASPSGSPRRPCITLHRPTIITPRRLTTHHPDIMLRRHPTRPPATTQARHTIHHHRAGMVMAQRLDTRAMALGRR